MQQELMFYVQPLAQENSKCCWLACYKMLYSWKGRPVEDVDARIMRAGIALDAGLDISDWGSARNALGLSGYSIRHLRDFDNFVTAFAKHGPMWCAGNFLNGKDAHAILVVGVQESMKRLQYLDPYSLWNGSRREYIFFSDWNCQIKQADFAVQMWG